MKLPKSYTLNIIILNVIIFIIASILGLFIGESTILRYLALQPLAVIHGKYLWTIVTSIFMHASFVHLLVNMFSLYFIGTFLEKIIGRKRLLIFYVLAGIFASIFFALLAGFFGASDLGSKVFGDAQVFGVGASGAIFGLLGLLSVLTPKNKVYLIVGPLIALIIESVISSIFPSLSNLVGLIVTLYFFFAIFAMFSFNSKLKRLALPLELTFWLLPIIAIVPLIVIGLFIPLPIGNMAHLGGLVAGIIYGFYLRKRYPNKTSMISRLFSK